MNPVWDPSKASQPDNVRHKNNTSLSVSNTHLQRLTHNNNP